MGIYGPTSTWKVVYYPKVLNGGIRGVAFVEASDRHDAMYTFSQLYKGQYSTVISCEKL